MTASNVIAFPRKRRPVCPLDEAFARLRRTELAMEQAAAEIEAVARRLEQANQKDMNNG